MRHTTRWNLATPHPRANALAQSLRVSPLLAQTLLNCGVETPETAGLSSAVVENALRSPVNSGSSVRPTASPALSVTERPASSSMAIMTSMASTWYCHPLACIRRLGGLVEYHIPHRVDEDMGLNCPAIEQLIDAGAQLIVTVDCGVTAIEPAALARHAMSI